MIQRRNIMATQTSLVAQQVRIRQWAEQIRNCQNRPKGMDVETWVMDLYSRKIIAWVLSQSLEAIHVVECVNKAKQMRNVTSPLVFHSDRGIQFVSQAFQKVTEGMINSYSKKAYPWDNACIESFHSLLKREWLNRFKIFDYKHAYRLVFEYIETFYNTVRIHSHCGYFSPDEYEKQYRNKLLELEQKLAG